MQTRQVHETDGLRTFVVVFDRGDEPKARLEDFARDHGVTGASVSAIGAFESATLAYFDREELAYQDLPVTEQVEVLSFLGDIARKGEDPELHAHVVVGRRDGSTFGGHLRAATVWPTLEVVVQESPDHLRKRHDDATGLALIDLDTSG